MPALSFPGPPGGRSKGALLVGLVVCCMGALAGAAAAAKDNDKSGTVLDPVALQRLGVNIGKVDIRIHNVFDLSDPAENKRLYRWADHVHVRTHRSVIEHMLLFAPGDPYDPQALAESARLLRAADFVADAKISPGVYHRARNTIDVDVYIRDAWTLQPNIKLGRKGGETEYGFGLTEENLLGTGKSVSVAHSKNVDRNETRIAYSDPNIDGGRTRLNFELADTSDGHRQALSAGRPFFSLNTHWSVVGNALDDTRVDSMYDLGDIVDQFRHHQRELSLQGGLSRGLVHGRTRRWLAGFQYDSDRFEAAASGPPLLLPGDRKLVYPWVGWQIVADDFRKMTELNQMGRTEDIRLGLNLVARLGYSTRRLGADRDATIFGLSAHKGWEPGGAGRLLLLDASASARWERAGVRNELLTASAVYYHRILKKQLFSARLNAALSRHLDADQQILIGGDSGLRGYPLRYQSGQRSAVLSLEQRFFTDWYPFRLLRIGYALFLDAGRVWGRDPRGTPSQGTLSDFGVGLRVTSPRSSSASVMHIDLAFPLKRQGGNIDGVQLIVEKRSSF